MLSRKINIDTFFRKNKDVFRMSKMLHRLITSTTIGRSIRPVAIQLRIIRHLIEHDSSFQPCLTDLLVMKAPIV